MKVAWLPWYLWMKRKKENSFYLKNKPHIRCISNILQSLLQTKVFALGYFGTGTSRYSSSLILNTFCTRIVGRKIVQRTRILPENINEWFRKIWYFCDINMMFTLARVNTAKGTLQVTTLSLDINIQVQCHNGINYITKVLHVYGLRQHLRRGRSVVETWIRGRYMQVYRSSIANAELTAIAGIILVKNCPNFGF